MFYFVFNFMFDVTIVFITAQIRNYHWTFLFHNCTNSSSPHRRLLLSSGIEKKTSIELPFQISISFYIQTTTTQRKIGCNKTIYFASVKRCEGGVCYCIKTSSFEFIEAIEHSLLSKLPVMKSNFPKVKQHKADTK